MKLEGRVALITGAGSGIGRAIRADVSDSAQVRAMFAEVASHFGTLDVLVNNAGISEAGPSRRDEINRKGEAQLAERMTGGDVQTHWDITQNIPDEEWLKVLGVHLNGTFFCTREALKLMSKKNRGSIINMSSVAALRGIPIAPHYGAAKGGILSLTRSLALEVSSRNIRVNAICPGWIDTPMTQDFSPMMKMALASQIPLSRFGRPEDVASTAVFLASDDSSYFTGQWLSPNGGLFIG